jgi:hypothetical protein
MNDKLFEEILYECNVESLFEQVLREARLQEMVIIESGKIYISEIEETKEITDIKELKNYYKNYALKKLSTSHWKEVTVENTDPPLKIEITQNCIDHWYGDSNKRKQIIAIQGLPYFIQKMKNIKPELSKKSNKKQIDYLYKSECSNVIINGDVHTIKLTIIKRFHDKEHKAYSWYINNLFCE